MPPWSGVRDRSFQATYRFAATLRAHRAVLDACVDRAIAALRAANPDLGPVLAVDGSDTPAYASGQRFVSKGGA